MLSDLMDPDTKKDKEKKATDHIPVMLNEIIDHLHLQANGIYVDCTLGLGGHAQSILDTIGPQGKLVGIDRDGASLKKAEENLKAYMNQCTLTQDDFRNLDQILEKSGIDAVDGILLDLGLSSYQMDDAARGFSIQASGPLDMRMDQNSYIAAYDLINTLSENEIASILKDFGEERWYKRIAHLIIEERNKKPIETTRELRHIVLKAMPYKRKRMRIHPATRTFQAFRIAVNRELESLEVVLEKCVQALNKGGRLAVIAFHSLEDRIVKHKFKEFAKEDRINILTKKPLRPSEDEKRNNPRSRSARLRVAERIS